MSCCTIFKKSLFSDISKNQFTVETSWLTQLIPGFDPAYSGIWLPIFISGENSNITHVDILSRSKTEQLLFNPCNCVSSSGESPENDEDAQLDCSYCYDRFGNGRSISWTLTNQKNGQTRTINGTTCCDGACDTRLTKDDYLTKLPVLNSSYLMNFHDWKYHKQFPAVSNLGFGKEKFIHTNTFNSFIASNAELVIDWKIKERISEIPPSDVDTYHTDIDTHSKSYKRSLLNSQTCGNFILTKLESSKQYNPTYPIFSGLISDIANTGYFGQLLPSVESFTKPYGFKNQDHYNIFVKTRKLGSFWKWNYTSGILCWYRYYDIDLDKGDDNRVIPGVDLYISDGDVFYATNDGPESVLANDYTETIGSPAIQQCPSGLKLISNNTVTGVIPSGSEFMYISENLYSKFYNLLTKLVNLETDLEVTADNRMSPIKKVQLAALLSTGPNYHEVTVDLLKTVKDLENANNDYSRDIYKQINVFNSGMLKKQQHSLSKLNIVQTEEDLINTLANKYGSYVWIAPNTDGQLRSKNNYDSHIYFDLDFEPVVKESDTRFNRECRKRPPECDETIISKDFSYNQKIVAGSLTLSTNVDKKYINKHCISGNFTIDSAANAIGAYFNGQLIKEAYYGSGCSRFYQRYLRPSSYDLALSFIGDSLCENENFCNTVKARAYNRDSGIFSDSSIILDRAYPANYCNTNIDRIGFNRQGGVYYDSNIFGSGNVVFSKSANGSNGPYTINFKTKDVGIKLYNLEVYKLRDQNNPECKTFPLDQACKCFPLSYLNGYQYNCDGSLTVTNASNILYTPNISTQSSPTIKSYGGFSSTEINDILGSQRIPNHPSVGTSLTTVSRIIDPLNPYGCSPSITVSFDNYIYTKWDVNLPSLYNTSHADVWMKMTENVDLFRPTIPKYDEEFGDFEIINNPSYRRYTTKAEINSTILYGNQQKILFEKDSNGSSVSIELTNPFLYQLLAQMSDDIDTNKIMYSPLRCSNELPSQSDQRNSYMIPLNITFKRLPRKQYLAYKFQPLSTLGTLTQTFFHPNSGFIDNLKGKTSLTYNSGIGSFDFDYERPIFFNGDTSYSASGIMFKGTITKNVKRILDSINSLDTHKKLRLYIKYNDYWYQYDNPHVFGYYNKYNNFIYPGYPSYFEYTKEDKYKTQLSIDKFVNTSKNSTDLNTLLLTEPSLLIPASVKHNTKFNFFHNTKNTGTINLPNENHPIFYHKFTIDKNANDKILVPGTRAYFMLQEKDSALRVTSIEELVQAQQDEIQKDSFLQDASGDRWRYSGSGSKTSKDSYELVFPRNRRDDNFCESFLDYDNVNTQGYLANSNVPTERVKIYLIDSNNPQNVKEFFTKSKSIYSPSSDKYGNPISKFKKIKPLSYITTLTSIQLDGICESCSIPIQEGYLLIVKPVPVAKDEDEDIGYSPDSFVLYQDLSNSLKLERDPLLSNKMLQTKWGDIIGFDNRAFQDLNNSLLSQTLINNSYPSKQYDNILHSISINNLETGVFNAFFVTNYSGQQSTISSGLYSHTGSTYYNIHQVYNIGINNKYFENTVENYQNYLPFIDINFTNNTDIIGQPWYNNLIQNFNKNLISTGNIYISGIRSFTDTSRTTPKPESGSYFFVNLNKDFYLRPILFNREFYYDTLRIDDVYYRLASLKKEESYSSANCLSVYRPTINFNNATFPDFFNVSQFNPTPIGEHYFKAFPVYCDTDRIGKCSNESCSIATIGWTRLKAGYNHYEDNPIKVSDIDEDTLEYALSVDEGIYNVIGNNSLPYIQRFEIPPYSNLFPNLTMDGTTDCVINADSRPDRPQNYIDNEYQNKLLTYILSEDSKGTLVKNTDILANEMLFRVIYGSKQKISYDTIKKQTVNEAIENKNYQSLSHLLQYSNPRTTADLIYKLIPYDYSTSSDTSKRKINGTIAINGILTVGSSVSVVIGDKTLNISIINEDGKIYSSISCDGETGKSLIHTETNIVKSLISVKVVSGQEEPASPGVTGPNESIELLRICDYPDTYTWGKGSYFSSAHYTGADENGDPVQIDIGGEYNKCRAKVEACVKSNIANGTFNSCCVNFIDWGDDPPDPLVISSTCAPPHEIICTSCDSRGVSDPPEMSPRCSIIDQYSRDVSCSTYARGLFGGCPARNSTNVQLSPAGSYGTIDGIGGGTAVLADGNMNSECKQAPTSCQSSCVPFDFSDRYGKTNTPFRNMIYGVGVPVCECQNYNYSYCAIPENTCSCINYAPGFPKNFNYEFEYCNYEFSNMRGHLYKYADGDPPKWGGQHQEPICLEEAIIPAIDNGAGGTEVCYWTECYEPAEYFYIYEKTTTTIEQYNPLCPDNLCSITYDNNKITVGLKNNTFCFNHSLRNDCPLITITLPNNTFTYNDFINSECTECNIEENFIKSPVTQVQDWDLITETRTVVLNNTLTIDGDLNKDVVGGGALAYVDREICEPGDATFCNCDNCYRGSGGSRQCGQSAPASWPWRYAAQCHLNGSPGIAYNTCTSRQSNPSITNVGSIALWFAPGSDNGTVKSRVIESWKATCQAMYRTYAPCFNQQGNIDVNDLVEGVIPGSCSSLQFGTLNIPAFAWKKDLNGGTGQSINIGVRYAYFTYQYKRPRTIQDVFLKENASKCITITSLPPADGYNMVEKYQIKNSECNEVPTCYDSKKETCDDNRYCCRAGKNRRDV